MPPSTHLYLRKASDDLVSYCRCDPAEALISSPGQMGCPWCGCGWLFICIRCRRAFTFAEVVEVAESWEEIAKRSIRSYFERAPKKVEVAEWIAMMTILLQDIRSGERYVYLDGWVIPTTAERVQIEGWHAEHDLDFVPQVAALDDRSVVDGLLASREYWTARAVECEE
jgi:hypothetical protein